VRRSGDSGEAVANDGRHAVAAWPWPTRAPWRYGELVEGDSMSDVTTGDAAAHATGADAQMGMQAMYELAAPQERYLELIAHGGCNFTEEFAELFPSSVFLGLMGLPEDEMRMFLDLRDGILHPEKVDPDALVDMEARLRVMNATGDQVYEYFGNLIDLRTK